MRIASVAMLAMAAVVASAQFTESEPNDTKATATNALGIAPGGTITGNSTSASGVGFDYFLVQTAAAPLGIYRYQMVLLSETVGHTGTIRGLSQTAATAGTWPGPVGTAGTTDSTAQSSSTATTPARMNQWYGFGKQESLYYRVTGVAATTANYTAGLTRSLITPMDLGNFRPGMIDIRTWNEGHTTDTDFWVYDGNLDPIAGYGCDDEGLNSGGGSPGTTLQGVLRRNYAAGTYYLAMTNFNLANNQGSPCDDDFRTGTMLDFAGGVLNSSTTVNLNLGFRMNDGVHNELYAATKTAPYEILWGKFTVGAVPEPGTMAVLGIGAAALIRRRRK